MVGVLSDRWSHTWCKVTQCCTVVVKPCIYPDVTSRSRYAICDCGAYMYRLYHEAEVSTGFIHRGPKAPRCVNRVETDTEWYNRLVPWSCIKGALKRKSLRNRTTRDSAKR